MKGFVFSRRIWFGSGSAFFPCHVEIDPSHRRITLREVGIHCLVGSAAALGFRFFCTVHKDHSLSQLSLDRCLIHADTPWSRTSPRSSRSGAIEFFRLRYGYGSCAVDQGVYTNVHLFLPVLDSLTQCLLRVRSGYRVR